MVCPGAGLFPGGGGPPALPRPSPAVEVTMPAETCVVDKQRVAAAVREILVAIGEDPEREGLRQTPRRVAEMYAELFAGLTIDPHEFLRVGFDQSHEEMVILKDISFYSLCEHHLLPFFGCVHVAYIPNGRVAGLSKLARVVDAFAR